MISKIVGNVTPSATCELEGLIGSMKKEGINVVALNIGEPDFKTPEPICDACKDALDAHKTTYVATAGIPELRQAICAKLQRDNGLTYTPEQICVSTGAKQALFNAVMAVANPGDEVIIPTPGWVSYVEMVKLVGGVPVCVPCTPDLQLDLNAIRQAVTEKTAAIIINSPNNPTGAVYSIYPTGTLPLWRICSPMSAGKKKAAARPGSASSASPRKIWMTAAWSRVRTSTRCSPMFP